MEQIIVIDDFLNKTELKEAIMIIYNGSWKFGHTSNVQSYETPFWNMELLDNEFFSKTIKCIIEKTFSKKFKILRLYANGQTFGQDGAYHIDSSESNTYTFVLYLTKILDDYIETAGGNIFFKLPDKNYNICYEPVFNRGILFPSNFMHKSTSFSRYILDLRICVAWKLEEII